MNSNASCNLLPFVDFRLEQWQCALLRGVATELAAIGHQVDVYGELHDAWSVTHLLAEAGTFDM